MDRQQEDIKKSRDRESQLNDLFSKMPIDSRYYWCTSVGGKSVYVHGGCANITNRIGKNGLSKTLHLQKD